jgi:hypothetical protein
MIFGGSVTDACKVTGYPKVSYTETTGMYLGSNEDPEQSQLEKIPSPAIETILF